MSPRSDPGLDWGVRVVREEFEEVELELSGPVFETVFVNWLDVLSDLLGPPPPPASF